MYLANLPVKVYLDFFTPTVQCSGFSKTMIISSDFQPMCVPGIWTRCDLPAGSGEARGCCRARPLLHRPLHGPIQCGRLEDSLIWRAPTGLSTNSISFCFLFVKKSLFYLEGKSMTPCWETLFSVVPPSNSLVSVSDPWRAFWADTTPFKGPQLWCVRCFGTTEIHRHS